MRRIKTRFAGLEVDFIDRETAISQITELAEKGTWVVHVVYGPEGCGKTALFRQAAEVLRNHGYAVVHINPLAKAVEERFYVTEDLRELAAQLGAYLIGDISKLIEKAVELLYTAVRKGVRRRIALLADDVFQAIGLDRAEQLVKALLNMIEWPSIRYEKIVVLVASSEGATRERIGRHRWATIKIMWNMPKEGFKQLYDALPGDKPPFEDAWKLSGGNPKALEELYRFKWSLDAVVKSIAVERGLDEWVSSLDDSSRALLGEVVNDPDVLFLRAREEAVRRLRDQLVWRNLVIRIWDREPYFWIDDPPPERDPELGIGKYYAWQTPLHREAVRRVLS